MRWKRVHFSNVSTLLSLGQRIARISILLNCDTFHILSFSAINIFITFLLLEKRCSNSINDETSRRWTQEIVLPSCWWVPCSWLCGSSALRVHSQDPLEFTLWRPLVFQFKFDTLWLIISKTISLVALPLLLASSFLSSLGYFLQQAKQAINRLATSSAQVSKLLGKRSSSQQEASKRKLPKARKPQQEARRKARSKAGVAINK